MVLLNVNLSGQRNENIQNENCPPTSITSVKVATDSPLAYEITWLYIHH